jgi:hypothetical protein
LRRITFIGISLGIAAAYNMLQIGFSLPHSVVIVQVSDTTMSNSNSDARHPEKVLKSSPEV